jgi:hypothetical protein
VTAIRSSLLVSLVAMTMLVGCGGDKGPTAAEALQHLKGDVNALLAEINATNVKVTDDGSRVVRCRDNKIKRIYAATATKPSQGYDRYGLVTLMIGAKRDEYKLVQPKTATTPAVVRNRAARTSMTLDSPVSGVLTIQGSTDCLRSG